MARLSLALSFVLAAEPCAAAFRASSAGRAYQPAPSPVAPAGLSLRLGAHVAPAGVSPGASLAPLSFSLPQAPPGAPAGPLPAAQALPLPGLPAAAIAAAAATPLSSVPAAPSLTERLGAVSERVAEDSLQLGRVSEESLAGRAADHLRVLQDEALSSAPAAAAQEPPRLALPAPAPKKDNGAVRKMVLGSMAYKLGMEAMTTAVPFVAIKSLGGATAVALLVVAVYGTAQAVFGSFSGALTDRFKASRVLAAAVAAQGTLVAVTLGLAAAHLLAPWALFALYAAIGGAVGIAETARRLVPPLILGQDEEALRKYNGRLHRFYEVAGVAGSALTGFLIWKAGAVWAMIVTPPAALIGAWVFSRVVHDAAPRRPRPAAAAARPGPGGLARSYFSDLKRAGLLVARDRRLSALAVAMVLPQVIHRIFESLLLPLYAKSLLGQEALSAVLLTSSNFGELIGASLLLRWSTRFKGPFNWVRWGAYGLLGLWALSLTQALGLTALASLPVIVPLVLLSSMSWASSHLSLESDLQQKVSPSDQPRVISLLYGLFVAGAAVVSLIAGRFLDALPMAVGFAWINAAFTALAVVVWLAARRLR